MSLADEMRRLRELDWYALDVKDAGGWPWSLQLICCLLLLGLTCAGMHWYLAAPAKEELLRMRDQEALLILDYRERVARVAALDEVRRAVNALERRKAALREMLPTDAEVPALLEGIGQAAIDNRLAIDFIRLHAPLSGDHYIERPFDLQVRGTYHHLGGFLADVAALSHIVTLHDLTLARAVEESHDLSLSLLAKTYSYRHAGDAP